MKPPRGRQVVLDVRPYHREGREPFSDIIAVTETLASDQQLVLLNSFEPQPLYQVMRRKGFTHHAEQTEDKTWRITFWRD